VPSVLAVLGVVGAGPFSVLAILLLGVAGAVLWSREHTPQDMPTVGDDFPIQLLQWAIGLLPADRVDWGQAMLGELDRIDGDSNRWRFALGCVAGLVLVSPWGPVGPMATLGAAALGSTVVLSVGFVHFGLATNPLNWVMLAILAALVMGSVLAANVLLRRPGVAHPGLAGGLVIAATWLAFSRFTFAGIVSPINSVGAWSDPALLIAVPFVIGVGGAWRSRSAIVGRRAARLAGVSAGLVMFLVSTVAVVAIDGGPRDPGVGVAGGVGEAFFNVAVLALLVLPMATATIGWVAATATARLRQPDLGWDREFMSTPTAAEPAAQASQIRPIVLRHRAAVAVAVVMAVTLFLLAR
jgi:hypothetical protein